MKDKYGMTQRNTSGYVALTLVSIISLVMLVVSVSVAGRVISVGTDIGEYEALHGARAVVLSCVSIARGKVLDNTLGELEIPIVWKLHSFEQASCEIEITETPFEFNVRIVGRAGTNVADHREVMVPLSARIEKQTGRIREVLFL